MVVEEEEVVRLTIEREVVVVVEEEEDGAEGPAEVVRAGPALDDINRVAAEAEPVARGGRDEVEKGRLRSGVRRRRRRRRRRRVMSSCHVAS